MLDQILASFLKIIELWFENTCNLKVFEDIIKDYCLDMKWNEIFIIIFNAVISGYRYRINFLYVH